MTHQQTTNGNHVYHRTPSYFTGVFTVNANEPSNNQGTVGTIGDYHLFIRIGDKVYMEAKGVGEIVISFEALQNHKYKYSKYWKQYYDLSLMLSNDPHLVVEDIVDDIEDIEDLEDEEESEFDDLESDEDFSEDEGEEEGEDVSEDEIEPEAEDEEEVAGKPAFGESKRKSGRVLREKVKVKGLKKGANLKPFKGKIKQLQNKKAEVKSTIKATKTKAKAPSTGGKGYNGVPEKLSPTAGHNLMKGHAVNGAVKTGKNLFEQ